MVLSRETLIISLYPPSRLPPSRPRPHRRWNRGVGGAKPPGLKVDPLLNASPSLRSIHLINSAPQVKFPPAHYAPPFPPSLPPAPLPPPLQCLTFIGINTFDQFHPQVKFPSAPSAPLPPSRPLFNASPSLGSIHMINSTLR